MTNLNAKIFEMGNGFPSEGGILMDNAGGVYRLAETDGRIHTGDLRGNFIFATLEESDSDSEPFEARVEID